MLVAEIRRVLRDDGSEQAEDGRVFPLQSKLELGLVLVELVEVGHTPHCNCETEQVPHGPTVGQGEARIQLVERLQGEATLREAGVRDGQPGLVHDAVAVDEEVEVDRARAEALPA